MTIDSYANAVFSDHALSQMVRRGIDRKIAEDVLEGPQQVLEVRPGRVVLQSRFVVEGKEQLFRVFVDVDEIPKRVVTVYRTTKIDKYWREP